MTDLLRQAFEAAARLSVAEQDVLASRILAEVEPEDDFDRAIAGSADKLAALADEALAEHLAGKTEPLDPDRLVRLPTDESDADLMAFGLIPGASYEIGSLHDAYAAAEVLTRLLHAEKDGA